MLTPSPDRSQTANAREPIPFRDPAADIGRADRRPTWWLDDGEHARLLGVKPRAAKAPTTKFVVKRRAETPPPPQESPEVVPAADFAVLAPTLKALDQVLQPLAANAPGLAPLLRNRRIKRIGRLGAAFGLATLVAAVVFFR
jgi:hypothetical protein